MYAHTYTCIRTHEWMDGWFFFVWFFFAGGGPCGCYCWITSFVFQISVIDWKFDINELLFVLLLQDYHSTRILSLAYQPFAFVTVAILAYYEAGLNTRTRNLAGYSLFFISSALLIVVSVSVIFNNAFCSPLILFLMIFFIMLYIHLQYYFFAPAFSSINVWNLTFQTCML